MVEEYRKGYVYIQNKYAGIIAETDEGYTFSYDSEYLMDSEALSLSLTMPLQAEAYYSNVLFPFFDGLIPEGWLLNIVSRNWKIWKSWQMILLIKDLPFREYKKNYPFICQMNRM